MLQKLQQYNAKKDKTVILVKDLPTHRAFGNTRIIKKGEQGTIISNGFEEGMIHVSFYSHYLGTEKVKFNIFSAEEFLTTDVY